MQQIGLPTFKASTPSFDMYHRPRTSQTVCYKKLTTLIEQRYKKLHLKDQKRILIKSFTNLSQIKRDKQHKNKKIFTKKQRKTQGKICSNTNNKKKQNNWYQNLLKSQKIAFALKTNTQGCPSSYPYRNFSSHSITNSQIREQFIDRTMPACSANAANNFLMPTAFGLHNKQQSQSKFMPYSHQQQITQIGQRFKKSGSLSRMYHTNPNVHDKFKKATTAQKQSSVQARDALQVTSYAKQRKPIKYAHSSQNNSKQNTMNCDDYFGKWKDFEQNQDKGYIQEMLFSAWGKK